MSSSSLQSTKEKQASPWWGWGPPRTTRDPHKTLTSYNSCRCNFAFPGECINIHFLNVWACFYSEMCRNPPCTWHCSNVGSLTCSCWGVIVPKFSDKGTFFLLGMPVWLSSSPSGRAGNAIQSSKDSRLLSASRD